MSIWVKALRVFSAFAPIVFLVRPLGRLLRSLILLFQ